MSQGKRCGTCRDSESHEIIHDLAMCHCRRHGRIQEFADLCDDWHPCDRGNHSMPKGKKE